MSTTHGNGNGNGKCLLGLTQDVPPGRFEIWARPFIEYHAEQVVIAPEMDGEIDEVFVSGLKETSIIVDRQERRIVLGKPPHPATMVGIRGTARRGHVRATLVGTAPTFQSIKKLTGGKQIVYPISGSPIGLAPGEKTSIVFDGLGDLIRQLDSFAVLEEPEAFDINDILVGNQSIFATSASVPGSFFSVTSPVPLVSPAMQIGATFSIKVTNITGRRCWFNGALTMNCIEAR